MSCVYLCPFATCCSHGKGIKQLQACKPTEFSVDLKLCISPQDFSIHLLPHMKTTKTNTPVYILALEKTELDYYSPHLNIIIVSSSVFRFK